MFSAKFKQICSDLLPRKWWWNSRFERLSGLLVSVVFAHTIIGHHLLNVHWPTFQAKIAYPGLSVCTWLSQMPLVNLTKHFSSHAFWDYQASFFEEKSIYCCNFISKWPVGSCFGRNLLLSIWSPIRHHGTNCLQLSIQFGFFFEFFISLLRDR